MTRSLSVSIAAMLLAAPLVGSAQTAEPKKDETQPSQRAATPEPAKPTAPAVPTVTLYGTINVNTQWSRSVNATPGVTGVTGTSTASSARDIAPRLGVSNDSSNVGVRAALPFAPWGKAQVQCESSAVIDGTGTNSFCNRNSQIGVSGMFGTLFIGNWDTPYKSVTYGTKADDPFGNTDVFDRAGIIGSPGFNVKSGGWRASGTDTVTNFAIRAQNSVAYWTPSFMGLSAKFQYGTNEFTNGPGTISPKLWSANLVYDKGPLSIVAAYENHENGFGLVGFNVNPVAATFGVNAAGGVVQTAAAVPGTATFGATAANNTTAHSEDYGWRVGAGYEIKTPFGATTPNFVWETLKYMQPRGPANSIKDYGRNAWSASLKHRVGAHELRGRFDQARKGYCSIQGGATCNTDGFGAKMLSVGYAYYFAAPTQLYVTWTQIRNDRNAEYTWGTGGLSAVSSGTGAANVKGSNLPGQDPQALAIGLRHAF